MEARNCLLPSSAQAGELPACTLSCILASKVHRYWTDAALHPSAMPWGCPAFA